MKKKEGYNYCIEYFTVYSGAERLGFIYSKETNKKRIQQKVDNVLKKGGTVTKIKKYSNDKSKWVNVSSKFSMVKQ